MAEMGHRSRVEVVEVSWPDRRRECWAMAARLAKSAVRRLWITYGVAIGVPILDLVIRLPLAFILADKSPFITFFLATAVSASFGGFGPGLIATAIGAFLAARYIILPVGSVVFTDPDDY